MEYVLLKVANFDRVSVIANDDADANVIELVARAPTLGDLCDADPVLDLLESEVIEAVKAKHARAAAGHATPDLVLTNDRIADVIAAAAAPDVVVDDDTDDGSDSDDADLTPLE